MKEYLRSRLFTLSAASHKYFGPLYRPGRETHSYSPVRGPAHEAQ
jgi:hypothetical protein